HLHVDGCRRCLRIRDEDEVLVLLARRDRHLVTCDCEFHRSEPLLGSFLSLFFERDELPFALECFERFLCVVLGTPDGCGEEHEQGGHGGTDHEAPEGCGVRDRVERNCTRARNCFATSFQKPQAKPRWIATNTRGMRTITPAPWPWPSTKP